MKLRALFLSLALMACNTDADGDGYRSDVDCDDASAAVHPDASEVCNGIDDDCNGSIDDADDGLDTSTTSTFFADVDSDGFGDPDASVEACEAPAGFLTDSTDCDDSTDAAHPGHAEICDAIDNDCDALVDDDDDSLDLSTATVFFVDGDGDGHGRADASERFCSRPEGYSSLDDDCDDADAGIHPSATDVPQDGIDQDCTDGDAPYPLSDLAAGDLFITEVMRDPEAVADEDGEWFEVYNNAGGDVDLDGLYVLEDDGDSFTVRGALRIDADGYAVFGNNSDIGTNGGVAVDYSYETSIRLDSGSGGLTLAADSEATTVFDGIAWDDGATFPGGPGESAQLSDDAWDAGDNDEAFRWCSGTEAYGDGDLGTPGTDNAVCEREPFNIGHDTELGESSTHGANYLLGSRLVVSRDVILDKFGLIGLGSGPSVKMALYSDAAGSPGTLIAQTSSTSMTGTRQELDIADVPIPAGTYYIMAVYDRTARISFTTASSETVWYRSLSYGSALPTAFGSALTYTGQEFSYYLVVY